MVICTPYYIYSIAPLYGQLSMIPASMQSAVKINTPNFSIYSSSRSSGDDSDDPTNDAFDSMHKLFEHNPVTPCHIDSTSTARFTNICQPQDKNGKYENYIANHLISLPHGHVLRLLARCSTKDGRQLTAISSMQLVRYADGAPAYMLNIFTNTNNLPYSIV